MRRLFTLLLASLLCLTALANDDGFYYLHWNVAAHVSQANQWNIAEQYQVYYREQRHGIYRYIQNEFGARRNINPDVAPTADVRYRIYRPDVKVKHTEGGEVWIDPDNADDCTLIRWGSADQWIEGRHDYLLLYEYTYPDDRITARDYLFHSLLPSDVTTSIQTFHFDLTFEQPLPDDIAERLHFYSGPEFSSDEAAVQDLQVSPTHISGTLYNLPPYCPVTLYAELPEGYFQGEKHNDPKPAWAFFWLTIGLAVLALCYEFFGQGPQPVKSVEFYAPEGVTPIMVGKIIDDSTDDIDIAAMIPWLAEQGYITIHETGQKGQKANDLKLERRLPVPDTEPEHVHKLMKMLFGSKTSCRMNHLGDRHSQVAAVKESVNTLFAGEQRLITNHHDGLMFALIVASTLALAFGTSISTFYSGSFLPAICWAVSFLLAWRTRLSSLGVPLFISRSEIIYSVLRLLLFGGVCYYISHELYGTDWVVGPYGVTAFLVLCLAACEFSHRNVHNSSYRTLMAGKLLGLHEFIRTAEKDRLKALIDDDPSYFYKVLPYAMIFGLTDKWTDIFHDYGFDIPATSWYDSLTDSPSSLSSSFRDMSSSLKSAITTSSFDHTAHSSSGSSSGGSSSGGGYSGGGGGGGGAGSW